MEIRPKLFVYVCEAAHIYSLSVHLHLEAPCRYDFQQFCLVNYLLLLHLDPAAGSPWSIMAAYEAVRAEHMARACWDVYVPAQGLSSIIHRAV